MRTILHADMDAFYASVEQREDPALRGRPVIVAGLGRRGVVSAASYEARAFGVHSAMPTAIARRKCPQGCFVPVRMPRYVEVSRRIHAVFARFTPEIEPLSLDEAFLDVTGSRALFGDGAAIATQIRAAVREETGLAVSVGVASSKFVAKVASDLCKPDGLAVVAADEEARFLAPLPVARLWGLGPQGQHRLGQLGYRTFADLQALDEAQMLALFGEGNGAHFHRLCRGIDERPVESDREAKSVSHETTFEVDLTSRERCHQVLLELCGLVGRRLRRSELCGAVVKLKVRDADFRTRSRQRKVGVPTQDDMELYRCAVALFDAVRPVMAPVRLLGIGVTGLVHAGTGTSTSDAAGTAAGPPRQGLLFEDGIAAEAPVDRRSRGLLAAMDAIRDRFGERAIRRAATPGTGGGARQAGPGGKGGTPAVGRGRRPPTD